MALAQKGGDFIYNLQRDSAEHYLQLITTEMGEHPIVPLMEGVHLLWSHLPALQDSVFNIFLSKMQQTVDKSAKLPGDVESNAEALFFELAARGLMAEYYADRDEYMKALGEANKAYKLVKLGFEKTDEINEFLFTTGLYNYFREKYPQIYPVYKPFVWIFKSGDQELGLRQLDEATRNTIISRIEAHIYISYIYLRYEDTPEKAQEYLSYLVRQYPNNLYLLTKFMESMRGDEFLTKVSLKDIKKLEESQRPYFKMAGNVFKGLYEEKVVGDTRKAFTSYSKAIEFGKLLPTRGEFYKSVAYLGMGRVIHPSRPQTAKVYLNKALEFAETKDVKKEARQLLRN